MTLHSIYTRFEQAPSGIDPGGRNLKGNMAKDNTIKFQAALLQSSPNSKPIKFNPEGGGEIVFEFDSSQAEAIKRFIGRDQEVFTFVVKGE